MDKNLLKTAQAQVNEELYSAYLYLAMSAWADSAGWQGFSHWFRIQAKEEMTHAMAIHDQLLERGQRSILEAIECPQEEWKSPLDAMEQTLAHEKHITAKINGLADLALDSKDHAFYQFIQLFIQEQVEEEASVNEILNRLRRADGQLSMLDGIDRELATRVFTPTFGVESE